MRQAKAYGATAAIVLGIWLPALESTVRAYTPMDCAGYFCTPRTLNPDAHIKNLPEITDPNVTDSDRVIWVERCKPRKHFDGLTIRWVYAEKGCEAGPMHLE
jgi:hypothetical protein